MRVRRTDDGQATVELALALPLLCLLLLGVVQVAVVARDQLAVQLAAREAARQAAAGATAGEASAAGARSVSLAPVHVAVNASDGTVTATASYVDHTDVPFIGALLPDVEVRASVTMSVEPADAAPPHR